MVDHKKRHTHDGEEQKKKNSVPDYNLEGNYKELTASHYNIPLVQPHRIFNRVVKN